MSTTPAFTDQQLIQAGQAYMAAACSGTASQAVAAMRAVLGAQAEQREAIGYMSPAQLPAIRDVEDLAGAYIPMRKTPGGMFTLALYTAPSAVQEPQWPKARDVGRMEDMSPSGHLRVGLDGDNDVYVAVFDGENLTSVEFCNLSNGGGRSSRTRMALIALMVAMEADNAERPDLDWWALRSGAAAQGGA